MQQRAWLVFLLMGIGAVAAAPIMLLGNPPDPPSAERLTGLSLSEIAQRVPGMGTYVSSLSTQLGNFMLATGVLLIAIAVGPFRRGERWSWYTLWIVPVLLLVQFVNSNFGLGWQFDIGLVPVMVGALAVSYRRFFPA